MPTLQAFFTNMSVRMPIHKKLYLVFRNNMIKIVKRQSCCGHPGKPGC
jgi:hypothetical protein